ncbi:hypothetical protein HK101_007153 [Irineochytrium annulatum]|nr:hypothetical protein HK101_007153 [Irineochytrium annulatum]
MGQQGQGGQEGMGQLVAGGIYKLGFGIEEYLVGLGREVFFPVAEVCFDIVIFEGGADGLCHDVRVWEGRRSWLVCMGAVLLLGMVYRIWHHSNTV